jgi:hypothetical protein
VPSDSREQLRGGLTSQRVIKVELLCATLKRCAALLKQGAPNKLRTPFGFSRSPTMQLGQSRAKAVVGLRPSFSAHESGFPVEPGPCLVQRSRDFVPT